MLFNEIYSSYFNVVAEILARACSGELKQSDIGNIVSKKAFGESILNIPASLKNGEWLLLKDDMTTPIKNVPTMPLTLLEKQWLKALEQDPRIRLFAPSFEGLEDVEPLYRREWIEYFDRYSDGDDFEDENYIENFRLILKALREYRRIAVDFNGRHGLRQRKDCIPYKLEYSSKDDKFRLIAISGDKCKKGYYTLNLSRIKTVRVLGHYPVEQYRQPEPESAAITVELTDERNCLERFMMNFSHLEKQAQKLDDLHYRITLKYDKDDETEILIRILSFGPKVKVIEPDYFISLIRQRLEKQEKLN